MKLGAEVPGLTVIECFIEADAEKVLLWLIGELFAKHKSAKRGHGGNRSRILRFGWDYSVKRWMGEIPEAIDVIGQRLGEFNSVTINEYLPGSRIAPHFDSNEFDELIAVLSLGSACQMEFSKGEDICCFKIDPCSVLTMEGDARYKWQHAISPVSERRVSIVFRRRDV